MEKDVNFVKDWIAEFPLYKKKEMSTEETQEVSRQIQAISGRFDQYCPACQQNATFQLVVPEEFGIRQQRLAAAAIGPSGGHGHITPAPIIDFSKKCICTRNNHHQIYHFRAEADGLVKVGQWPSMADVSAGDLSEYRKAFTSEELKELKRAIGLHAFGVGVGAFIYLRRVFERQVEGAYNTARADSAWIDTIEPNMKMAERIKALRCYLPDALVNNSNMYSILSEHIHSLTEKECLENFNILLQGIFVIAGEKMAKLEQKRRLDEFERGKAAYLARRSV